MRRNRSGTHPAASNPHASRRIHEEREGKLPELACCPVCKASYRAGRWTWKAAPIDAYELVCPACERIEMDYPAGVIHLVGDFAVTHRDELIGLIRNIEERERSTHPLKRVMTIADDSSGLCVTVTDGKLVDALGRALHKAYAGRVEHAPTTSDKENLVRALWTRD